ncbi:MAG: hypothetical protein U0521_05985 [Anaerolineae bacterium]
MSRRLLILLLPALALVVWLVAAQLPRWTAPVPGWFAPGTPGVCAAVRSLALYDARRVDPASGLGREAAQSAAEQVAADHYDAAPLGVSEPLAVEASLPGAAPRLLGRDGAAERRRARKSRRDLSGRRHRRAARPDHRHRRPGGDL